MNLLYELGLWAAFILGCTAIIFVVTKFFDWRDRK